MDPDKLGLIAQEISFAFEDLYNDVEKRQLFDKLFLTYLSSVDPESTMEPYQAIIQLGRKNPEEFEKMVKEMKGHSLIS